MLRSIEANDQGFAERDGVRVHYQVFGEGEQALLLLPTWSIVHSDFWRSQVPHLASSYTVVTFDGRGNGCSDRPAESLAYAEREFADDAIAVLDAIGIEKAAIVSASQGGCWGLVLAAELPERITAAVFIAPDLPFGPGHPEQERADELFDEKLEEHDGWLKWNRHYWRADWPGFLEFFFSNCFTEPDSRSQIDHFLGMGMETDPHTIIATIQAPALDEPAAERLAASIRIPTLVIHGDHDAITPLHRGQTLARLASAELVVLPGSGHEPQCRIPEQVNGMLDEFLSRHFRAI
ncbi:MAG: alpha/beta fold hydrolase [Solirubrobacterales bacterium]